MRMKPRTAIAAITAIAVIAVGTGVGLNIANADSNARPSALVPIAPCRLIDTRSASNVGEPKGALNPGEPVSLNVVGVHGNCSIPTGSAAIAINVTVVNPTASSYLTVYPAEGSQPVSSNINWTP